MDQGRSMLARRAAGLAVAGTLAAMSAVAFTPVADAAPAPVTAVAVQNQNLLVIDFVAGNAAFIDIAQVGKSPDVVIKSKDRIALGANCRYLWQTDNDPANDTAQGFDRWARCTGAYMRYEVHLGDGNDSLTAKHPTGTVFAVGGPGNDTIKVWDGTAELYGDNGPGQFLPPLSEGGDDTLVGAGRDDHIFGGGGNDGIRGVQGNDTLIGSDGEDTIDGGVGKDTIIGGLGFDIVDGQGGVDTMKMRNNDIDQITCNRDAKPSGAKVVDVLEWDAGKDILIGCTAETGGGR
jgi:Ca2+-binding RTX toxin-like protein